MEFRKERDLVKHRASAAHLGTIERYACEEPNDADGVLDEKRLALFAEATGIVYEDEVQLRRHGKRIQRLHFCRCVLDWVTERCEECGEKSGYLTAEDKKELTKRIYAWSCREKEFDMEAKRRRSSLKIPNMALVNGGPSKIKVEKKKFQDLSLLQRLKMKADAFVERFKLTPEQKRARSPLKRSTERAKVKLFCGR